MVEAVALFLLTLESGRAIQAQVAADPLAEYKFALVSAVLVSLIGASVTIAVAWRNNKNQRALAAARMKAESEAAKSEAAARAAKEDREFTVHLLEAMRRDNDRLREIVGECEGDCDQLREDLGQAREVITQLRIEKREDAARIESLETRMAQLERDTR